MSEVPQLLIDGLIQGSKIWLVAAGFALIFAVTRTLHVAHGAIITVGAYLIWWLTAKVEIALIAAIIIAMVVQAVLGVTHELIVYRPIRRKATGGFIIVVASLGTGLILQNLMGVIFGFGTKNIRESTIGAATEGISIGSAVVPTIDLITAAVGVALLIALEALLRWTRIGHQMRAVEDNAGLARVVGISAPRVYLIVYAIGSAAGIAASMLIGLNSGIGTTIGFDAILIAMIATFAGGVGSMIGAFIAALSVGVIQSLSLLVVDSRWQATVAYSILLLLVAVRPRGLLGREA